MKHDSAIKKLETVLTDSYSRFIRSWDASPLGHKQQTMAYALAAQCVTQRLPDIVSVEDAQLLLGLKDPLDAVSKEWVKTMGLEQPGEQELRRSMEAVCGMATPHRAHEQSGLTMG